ncbi:unnamed protein product [Caenorhabditis auriculariae]|uniref:Uncharacterized protein n=1 Tax=Caenorhabditis auriculariae TaxID=2777116 RepID=A0A8S1GUB1_9PELO|nr:unnamed protein product [Caenorhabditis auriculariae]
MEKEGCIAGEMTAASSEDQPLELLRMVTERELIHHLEELPGPKELVVDRSLLRPLDGFTSNTELKKHGVQRVFTLNPDASVPAWIDGVVHRVYLVRPSRQNARLICEHVRAIPGKSYAAIWCNAKLSHCDFEFESSGIYGKVQSFDLAMCLLPIETDLFSLEHPESPHGDIFSVANSFVALQGLYGVIPTVYGLGKATKKMWSIVHKLCENNEPRARPDQPISHLFVFDRSIDPVTTLLTAGTYEALVHNVFNIDCGKVDFAEVFREKQQPEEEAKPKAHVYKLNNNDGVYASIRNKFITGVSSFLSSKTKEMQSDVSKATATEQVSDMRVFVESQLRNLRAQHRQLELHISACEVILRKTKESGCPSRNLFEQQLSVGDVNLGDFVAFVNERMLQEDPPFTVLSLLCLATVLLNGIPDAQYESLLGHFYKVYGFEYIMAVYNLREQGLLYSKNVAKQRREIAKCSVLFRNISKRLRLFREPNDREVDLRNPSSMSYVFGGTYTPLFCQVVSNTMTHGWNTEQYERGCEHVLVEQNSYVPPCTKPDNRMKKAIMVFFLGGVTYAEVAALRLLAVQNNFRILIAATHIIRRDEYVRCRAETLVDRVE